MSPWVFNKHPVSRTADSKNSKLQALLVGISEDIGYPALTVDRAFGAP